MTEHSNSTAAGTRRADALDPASLADGAGVDVVERTYEHEAADHCEADGPGRVIVGVTNDDDAVLLLVDRERSHAILPNCTLESGESWRAVARETAERVAGTAVKLGDPITVRRVEHVLEGEDEPHTVTHHVVFPGTLDGDATLAIEDKSWEAEWFHDVPVELDEGSDVADDIETFL